VLAPIGTGTFGQVLLAKHKPSGAHVAIKQLSKARVIKLKQLAHLRNERDVLSQCDSPFIIRSYGCFQDKRCVYLALEYVPGGELFTLLRTNKRFSTKATRLYAAQVVLALRYLHDRGLMYRDIKPENLLIDAKGNIKLVDFGFAKSTDAATYTVCGTPEYMAPEIIQNRGHGASVDWWALGVLVYEMLVGQPPHRSSDQMRLYSKILRNDINFPPALEEKDPDAVSLITSLMCVDRSERLGCGIGGAQDVMDHIWFETIDWSRVEARTYRMPFEPMLVGATDTSYFLTDNQVFGRDFDARFDTPEAKKVNLDKLFADF